MTTTAKELGEREENKTKKRKEKRTGHGFAPATTVFVPLTVL
jgi:hypothetical protein